MRHLTLSSDQRGAYVLEGLAFFVFILGPLVAIGFYGQILLSDVFQFTSDVASRPYP